MPANYPCVLERGVSEISDWLIDFIKPHIVGTYLDVGCNTGWLLSEVPGGTGIDDAPALIEKAIARGLNARLAPATQLPFPDASFDTVVLSRVLEQIHLWKDALYEAARVGRKRVIGICPLPGRNQWGFVGGWVKSIIPPATLIREFGAECHELREGHYFFRIDLPLTNP